MVKKQAFVLIMSVLTIVIAVVAIIVGVMAVMRQQWLITAIMLVVIAGQIINYLLWKKRLK